MQHKWWVLFKSHALVSTFISLMFNYKQGIFVCLSVCDARPSRTVHLIYFTLGWFVTDSQKRCSVWFNINERHSAALLWVSRHKKNGHQCSATTCCSNSLQWEKYASRGLGSEKENYQTWWSDIWYYQISWRPVESVRSSRGSGLDL